MDRVRRLPSAPEAERAILGAVLLDPRALEEAAHLTPDAFVDKRHAAIWRAMQALAARGSRVDHVTLLTELSAAAAPVDRAYVLGLVDGQPTQPAIGAWAREVTEAAARRAVIMVCHNATISAADRETSLHEVARDVQQAVEDAAALTATQGRPAGVREYAALAMGTEADMRFGLAPLDEIMGGVPLGDLVVILGSPAAGKTVLLQQTIEAMLIAGKHVLFASLDMSAQQVVARHLQSLCRLERSDVWEAVRAMGDDEKWRQGGAWDTPAAMDAWLTSGQYVVRDARSVGEIRAAAAAMRTRPAIVAVDYLQMMQQPHHAGNRTEGLDLCVLGLKRMARDLSCVVLLVSQMRRHDGRTDPSTVPAMSDGRGSQEIEAEAAAVLGVWQPDYHDDVAECRRVVDCRIAVLKNKHGAQGVARMSLDKPYMVLHAAPPSDREENER